MARWRRIQPRIQMPDSFTELRNGHCHPLSCHPSYGLGKLIKQIQERGNLDERQVDWQKDIFCSAGRPITGWRYATWLGERMRFEPGRLHVHLLELSDIVSPYSVLHMADGEQRTEVDCGIIISVIVPAWPGCKHGGKSYEYIGLGGVHTQHEVSHSNCLSIGIGGGWSTK